MSSSELPLAIRFQPIMGVFMLVAAIFILGTTLLVGVSVNTITGLILFGVSLGYLTQPAIVVTEREFEHKNILGMTMRRQAFGSLADVILEDGSVYVNNAGTRQKVIGARFHLRGSDIEKLESMVRAAKG